MGKLEDLEKLGKLKEQGILTETEFLEEKEKILKNHSLDLKKNSVEKITNKKITIEELLEILNTITSLVLTPYLKFKKNFDLFKNNEYYIDEHKYNFEIDLKEFNDFLMNGLVQNFDTISKILFINVEELQTVKTTTKINFLNAIKDVDLFQKKFVDNIYNHIEEVKSVQEKYKDTLAGMEDGYLKGKYTGTKAASFFKSGRSYDRSSDNAIDFLGGLIGGAIGNYNQKKELSKLEAEFDKEVNNLTKKIEQENKQKFLEYIDIIEKFTKTIINNYSDYLTQTKDTNSLNNLNEFKHNFDEKIIKELKELFKDSKKYFYKIRDEKYSQFVNIYDDHPYFNKITDISQEEESITTNINIIEDKLSEFETIQNIYKTLVDSKSNELLQIENNIKTLKNEIIQLKNNFYKEKKIIESEIKDLENQSEIKKTIDNINNMIKSDITIQSFIENYIAEVYISKDIKYNKITLKIKNEYNNYLELIKKSCIEIIMNNPYFKLEFEFTEKEKISQNDYNSAIKTIEQIISTIDKDEILYKGIINKDEIEKIKKNLILLKSDFNILNDNIKKEKISLESEIKKIKNNHKIVDGIKSIDYCVPFIKEVKKDFFDENIYNSKKEMVKITLAIKDERIDYIEIKNSTFDTLIKSIDLENLLEYEIKKNKEEDIIGTIKNKGFEFMSKRNMDEAFLPALNKDIIFNLNMIKIPILTEKNENILNLFQKDSSFKDYFYSNKSKEIETITKNIFKNIASIPFSFSNLEHDNKHDNKMFLIITSVMLIIIALLIYLFKFIFNWGWIWSVIISVILGFFLTEVVFSKR